MTKQYIAGFFDGEGSLTYNGKGYRITISQANKEVLLKIQKFFGFGLIFKNKKRKTHWLDSWVFYVAKQNDVLDFIKQIIPYTIVKTDKLKKVIPVLEHTVREINNNKRERRNRIARAKELRKKGLTYREIGNKMSIDFGYARRLILDID